MPGGPDLRKLCKIQAEKVHFIWGSALSRPDECRASLRLILTAGKIWFCKKQEKKMQILRRFIGRKMGVTILGKRSLF